MANEFAHKTVGTELTQAEFEGTTLHVCDGQATGDILYASSATQLSRLAIGATNTFLQVVGGVPAWVSAPTVAGTVTFGGETIATLGGMTVQGSFVLAHTGESNGVALRSGPDAAGSGAYILLTGHANTGALTLYTSNAAGTGDTARFSITGAAATAVGTFANITLTGIVLSGGINHMGIANTNVGGTWTNSGTWTIPAVTWGGTVTTNGQTLDAGGGNLTVTTTLSNDGLRIHGSHNDHGPAQGFFWDDTSPIAARYLGQFVFRGYDGAGTPANQDLAYMRVTYDNVTDGAEATSFSWGTWVSGAANLAMTLSGAGTVGGDLAYAEFDKWDDKAVVQQLNTPAALRGQYIAEQFADMGIVNKVEGHTASGGYMLNLQRGFWFNFHALKVAYSGIDNLTAKTARLENELAKLKASLR